MPLPSPIPDPAELDALRQRADYPQAKRRAELQARKQWLKAHLDATLCTEGFAGRIEALRAWRAEVAALLPDVPDVPQHVALARLDDVVRAVEGVDQIVRPLLHKHMRKTIGELQGLPAGAACSR
jgi:hypothetical protein